jgi:hypothetical protein
MLRSGVLGRWEVHVARAGTPATKLEEVFDLLNPKIVRAIRAANAAYARLGIRHALIGGLAVGVHGHPRATKDVDFLVGKEAFESAGVLVSFRPGVPLSAEGVPIDSILAPDEHASLLDEALARAEEFDGVPVIGAEYLVFMKLLAGRRQDLADVEALLLSAHLDIGRARELLASAPATARALFEELVSELDRPDR